MTTIWTSFLPAVVAAALLLLVLFVQIRFTPRVTALLAVIGAAAISLVGFIGSAIVASVYWMHRPIVEQILGPMSMAHHAPGPSMATGLVGSSIVVLGAVNTFLFFRRARKAQPSIRALRDVATSSVIVNDSEEVFAYSIPGRTPLAVVSSGLLSTIDLAELNVVLAHEDGHHRYRHDRLLFVGRLAGSLFLPARLFHNGLELAIERWADDHAATTTGDRRFAAMTVAKVALLGAERNMPIAALAFAQRKPLSTTRRVQSLLYPARTSPLASLFISGLTAVLLLTQLHHLFGLISILCRN